MNKTFIIILTAVVLIGGYFLLADKPGNLGAGGLNGGFYNATNSSAAITTATNTVVLANNPGRLYASFYNAGSNVVYLSFGTTSAAGKGVGIAAGTLYEINQVKLFTGAVYGSTASGTSTLAVVEK